MKLASIKPNELAVVKEDTWIAVGETLVREGALPTDFSMLDLIEKYASLKSSLAEALDKGNARKIDAKLLKPPVERPSKIWAAAGNYRRGSEGLADARGRDGRPGRRERGPEPTCRARPLGLPPGDSFTRIR